MHVSSIRGQGAFTIAFAMCSVNVVLADKPPRQNESEKKLVRATEPREFAAAVCNLLSDVRTDRLDRLVSSPDNSVAFAAAWERVRMTMPAAKGAELVRADSQAVARFLGVVEGRTQVPLPEIWEQMIRPVTGYSQQHMAFLLDKELIEKSSERFKPKRDGDRWIVKRNEEEFRVPIEPQLGPQDHATVAVDDGRAYLCLYGWPPSPFRLLAVDRQSKKTIWTTEVWAAGGLVAYGGLGLHFALVRIAPDRLVVFGISGQGPYIEEFDKKSGKNLSRFSSAFFDDIPPRK